MTKNEFANQIIRYLDDNLMHFYHTTDNTSHLQFNQLIHVGDNYVVAEFYGGLNGSGKWDNYLRDITSLFDEIQFNYKCWLVDLHNDCLDDVFYLKIGISNN